MPREPAGQTIVFSGTDEIQLYRAVVIRSALRMYKDTGRKANRAYTPQAMLRAAAGITGKEFKPRDYQGAIDALSEHILQAKEKHRATS